MLRPLTSLALIASIAPVHASALGAETPPALLTSFGEKVEFYWQEYGPHQFWSPSAVAIGSTGVLFVADSESERIQKFTPGGTYLGEWSVNGHPGVLAVGPGDEVYVPQWGFLEVYDSDGGLLREWGSLGSGPGQFMSVPGIGVTDEHVFLADAENHRIQKFTLDGDYVLEWTVGPEILPRSLAVGPGGDVYITETASDFPLQNIVRRYSPDGEIVAKWGELTLEEPAGPGEFLSPFNITVDDDGDVYVCDFHARKLEKFSGTGTFLWSMDLNAPPFIEYPEAIAVSSAGVLHVLDWACGSAGAVVLYGEAPLTLAADQAALAPGAELRLRTFGGEALAPVMLVLTAVNDTPFLAAVAQTTLDPFGAWSLQAAVPTDPTLAGSHFDLVSVSLDVHGQLVLSNEAVLSID